MAIIPNSVRLAKMDSQWLRLGEHLGVPLERLLGSIKRRRDTGERILDKAELMAERSEFSDADEAFAALEHECNRLEDTLEGILQG